MANPKAVNVTPSHTTEYFASRWIAEPLCLFDADMPVDGAAAVIVTTAERAKDLRQPPILIANVGSCSDLVQIGSFTDRLFPKEYAEEFWSGSVWAQ